MEESVCMSLDIDGSRKKGRYHSALKHLIPIRSYKRPVDSFPLSYAGCFSYITFSWMSDLVWSIYRKGIKSVKWWNCPEQESCQVNLQRIDFFWKEELQKGPLEASFRRVALKFLMTRTIVSTVFLILSLIFSFSGSAFILRYLLEAISEEEIDMRHGLILVATLVISESIRSLLFAVNWTINYQSGVRLRTAAMILLYQKILRIRNLKDKSVGELVNMCTNDGQRLFDAACIGPFIFGGPFIILLGFVYNYYLIGVWSLVGCFMFLAFYPLMTMISKLTTYYKRRVIGLTDQRVRMMNEILVCIKLIKLYAWEKSFEQIIYDIRKKELSVMKKFAFVQTLSISLSPMVPIIAAIFTFIAHVLSGNNLTTVQAFTMIAVLNSMRFSLGSLPYSVKSLSEGSVAAKRYKDVLIMEELEALPEGVLGEDEAIVLDDATLVWDLDSSKEQKPKHNSIVKKNVVAVNATGSMEDIALEGEVGKLVPDVEELQPVLRNISFVLKKGQMVGVCGAVGCGKSSLVSAVLGQMQLISGNVSVRGKIAYVPQQAWLMNATAQENILFGLPYDEERYLNIVRACSLESDFKALVAGDETEIGERGINLSGGQKQRIGLARAVYSDNDIYLLDDPLSAVDIHIGKHIFQHCIRSLLHDKTVLFVTHQLQYLSQCDQVMFLKDGTIAECGTHADLMKSEKDYAALIHIFIDELYTETDVKYVSSVPTTPDVDVALDWSLDPSTLSHAESVKFARQYSLSRPLVERQYSLSRPLAERQYSLSRPLAERQYSLSRPPAERQYSALSVTSDKSEDFTYGKLTVEEEQQTGDVGCKEYKQYIHACGGYAISAFVIFTFVISIAVQVASTWWLSYWIKQGSGNITIEEGNATVVSKSIADNPNMRMYILVYGLSVVAMLLTTSFRGVSFMKITLSASSKMHNSLFHKIMRCPASFFDTTPVGRLLNRFSVDIDEVEGRLPNVMETYFQNILFVVFSLVSVSYMSLWLLLVVSILFIVFIFLKRIFMSSVRGIKEEDNVLRSPLISHITASIQGISTVHAYKKTQEFIDKFCRLLDKNTVPYFLFYLSNRWIALRLDILTIIVTGMTGVVAVVAHKQISPALAGVGLSFAIQMTGLFQFTIRLSIETEARFTSVQRLHHYIESIESEPATTTEPGKLPSNWPNNGKIEFKKLTLRYQEGLPYVLKDISLNINPCQKIGIVGRSGSGKSTLGLALFRLVEPTSGQILIDGIDITTVGLDDLRSNLSIIPQDPILFVGTVRYNLDPFGQYNGDSALWEALAKCHVRSTIENLEHGLDTQVIENGENFSVGERQLICMARALLRNKKIMILDEATAAIDTETDKLVQETIKKEFSDCTILIIAHRLNTILDCNKILVLEDGKVVEFDKPSVLLSNSTSKFKTMLDATEEQFEDQNS